MEEVITPSLQKQVSAICDELLAGKISRDDATLKLCNVGWGSEIDDIKVRLDRLEADMWPLR